MAIEHVSAEQNVFFPWRPNNPDDNGRQVANANLHYVFTHHGPEPIKPECFDNPRLEQTYFINNGLRNHCPVGATIHQRWNRHRSAASLRVSYLHVNVRRGRFNLVVIQISHHIDAGGRLIRGDGNRTGTGGFSVTSPT